MIRKYFIVGSFFGIQLRIDYSWFVIFALIAWSVITSYLPSYDKHLTASAQIGLGLIITFIVFLSVVMHEYAHSLVANHRGLKIKRITLFIFGGASELQHEPDDPKTELIMTIVGPLCSLVLAGLFYVLLIASRHNGLRYLADIAGPVAVINLILGLFNLLPAYPLDGGRLLRSLLWLIRKNFLRATTAATNTGIALGYVIIGLGLLAIIGGDLIGGLWLGVIGYFLQQSARYSYLATLGQQVLSGLTVADVIHEDISSVPLGTSLTDYVNKFVLRYRDYDFLVTNHQGRPVGII